MDRIDRIKQIKETKNLAVIENDNTLVAQNNKFINNIIKDDIIKAKEDVGQSNMYKEYVINNREQISKQLAINKDVVRIEEAIILINQVDFRLLFGLDIELNKMFECDFINKEKRLSFAYKTEKEADEAIGKEIEKCQNKKVKIYSYKRFGMYVRELIIKQGVTQAWISYKSDRNKYLYMVGNNCSDTYYVNKVFDVLDLYQIFMNRDIKESIQELCELLDIRIREIEDVRNKYIRCKKFIESNLTESKFPALHQLIGTHISKLNVIFQHCMEKVYYHKEFDDNYIISFSIDYISYKMGKGKSTVNAVINTFVLLGLLQKSTAKTDLYSKWDKNEITFYFIPEYDTELFENAEQVANTMLNIGERITASNFSYLICIEKFGKETANLIFRDKVTRAKAS